MQVMTEPGTYVGSYLGGNYQQWKPYDYKNPNVSNFGNYQTPSFGSTQTKQYRSQITNRNNTQTAPAEAVPPYDWTKTYFNSSQSYNGSL